MESKSKQNKKLLFVHDHKFIKNNDEVYSPGGLSNEVLSRYTKYFDEIIVLGRIVHKNDISERYSKITNSKITVVDGKKTSYQSLKSLIINCDGLIIRLPSLLGLNSATIAILFKKKFIVELVGNAWDAYWLHSFKGKLVAGPINLFTKLIVFYSEYVIFVTKRYLQSTYHTKAITTNISNVHLEGMDSNVLENRLAKIASFKSSQKIIIGSIGSIDMKYKGYQYVIKALKTLNEKGLDNIEYHLVGSGNGYHLKRLIKKLNLQDKVKIIGPLPHEEIYSWLDSIDIYIQPSLTEGLPRALIEAMSRACPCIASSAGGNPELINRNYIFKKKSINELTNLIRKLMSKEMLIEESKRNYDEAKNYDKEHLEKKREVFIMSYLDEI